MQFDHNRRKLRGTTSVKLCLLFALAVHALTYRSLADADREYSVAGVVVTTAGAPVPGALVVGWPVAEGRTAGSLHWVPTDEKGEFKLKLARGSYQIRAKDERHGYPDPSFLLSADANARFPTIKVEDADVYGVRVTFGDQGGILRIIIRDRGTGRPIAHAKAVVRDAQDTRAFVELSADKQGNIQFATPHKSLVVLAKAPGYSTELFQNGGEVELSNGDLREIAINLTPE